MKFLSLGVSSYTWFLALRALTDGLTIFGFCRHVSSCASQFSIRRAYFWKSVWREVRLLSHLSLASHRTKQSINRPQTSFLYSLKIWARTKAPVPFYSFLYLIPVIAVWFSMLCPFLRQAIGFPIYILWKAIATDLRPHYCLLYVWLQLCLIRFLWPIIA